MRPPPLNKRGQKLENIIYQLTEYNAETNEFKLSVYAWGFARFTAKKERGVLCLSGDIFTRFCDNARIVYFKTYISMQQIQDTNPDEWRYISKEWSERSQNQGIYWFRRKKVLAT